MKLHVGTSGYAYKEWKGSFYPEKLPAKQFLSFYAEHFDAVEINNTFYRMPKPDVLQKWHDEVPEHFRFVVKASRRITHIKRLKHDDKGSLPYLFEVTKTLGAKLGPIYFQTPPNMKCDLERLEAFLGELPTDHPACFEFRHESWMTDDVFGLLRAHGCALVGADMEDRPAVVQPTASFGYLRLRLCEYDDAILKQWHERLKDTGWEEAWVFFKHEDEGTGPELARRFLELA